MRRIRGRTPTVVFMVLCCGAALAMFLHMPVGIGATDDTAAEQAAEQKEDSSAQEEGKAEVQAQEEQKLSINLQEAPLPDFLSAISKQLGSNFVLQPDVKDMKVTASMSDVSPKKALSTVLEAHGLVAEEKGDNLYLVKTEPVQKAPEKGKGKGKKEGEKKKKKKKPLKTEVLELDYCNADDVKTTLEPLLSNRGNIQVVERSGFTGWSFQQAGGRGGGRGGGGGSTFQARKKETEEYSRSVLSQMLIISDTKKKLEELKSVVKAIDTQPTQVLISARIVEVNRNKLRDLGVDIADGEGQSLLNADLEGRGTFLSSLANPSAFQSNAGSSPTYPFNTGLNLMFKKVSGSDFQVLLHALKEKADADTLSAPKLLTLDNQQATMLVGRRFPILSTQVSGTEVTQITSTLDYYENIGVQLNVIPQVQNEKYINMIIHPVVSNRQGTVAARSSGGQALAEYPIIATREAETQVMIEDNQTIVIGGLLKEEEEETVLGVPVLSDIPYLGYAFRRTTNRTVKQDLLLFLSAKIVPNPATPSESTVRHFGEPQQRDVRKLVEQADKLNQEGKYSEALRLLERLNLGTVEISDRMAERIQKLREKLRRKIQEEKEKKENEKNKEKGESANE